MKRQALLSLVFLPIVMGVVRPLAAQSFDHSPLDTVLARFVRDGRVDYAALKIGRAPLDAYLQSVAGVAPDELASWPEAERIAFLINAYNAYTLQTIVDHYPIESGGFFKKLVHPKRFSFPDNSIRQIDGVFDRIKHVVAGRELTLEEIQHGVLRPEHSEPRIHFALSCAAVSCPPLRGEAYRGDRLDAQLDDQGRQFLNDPRLNRVEIERSQVHLSKMFDWYGDDFLEFAQTDTGYQADETLNGVLAFVSRYLRERAVAFLE
ncbi:MAG TPA: DUF547 domain-containing protein, partial [Gemmatimonadota bacterium]|nr:DUF547 domain-containing protein [Gemmatimonadota bacterium]